MFVSFTVKSTVSPNQETVPREVFGAPHPRSVQMPHETNYIHEQDIWRQRLKTEEEGAAAWYDNWGFLAKREQSEPRGFSSNVAKYAYGQGQSEG